MLHRQEAELALRTGAESLSGETAGADRDLRLPYLIARAEHVRLRIQERSDALLLVVLEKKPPRTGHRGKDQHGGRDRPAADAGNARPGSIPRSKTLQFPVAPVRYAACNSSDGSSPPCGKPR